MTIEAIGQGSEENAAVRSAKTAAMMGEMIRQRWQSENLSERNPQATQMVGLATTGAQVAPAALPTDTVTFSAESQAASGSLGAVGGVPVAPGLDASQIVGGGGAAQIGAKMDDVGPSMGQSNAIQGLEEQNAQATWVDRLAHLFE